MIMSYHLIHSIKHTPPIPNEVLIVPQSPSAAHQNILQSSSYKIALSLKLLAHKLHCYPQTLLMMMMWTMHSENKCMCSSYHSCCRLLHVLHIEQQVSVHIHS